MLAWRVGLILHQRMTPSSDEEMRHHADIQLAARPVRPALPWAAGPVASSRTPTVTVFSPADGLLSPLLALPDFEDPQPAAAATSTAAAAQAALLLDKDRGLLEGMRNSSPFRSILITERQHVTAPPQQRS